MCRHARAPSFEGSLKLTFDRVIHTKGFLFLVFVFYFFTSGVKFKVPPPHTHTYTKKDNALSQPSNYPFLS